MYAEVHHVERLSPDLLRVVLTGGTLDQFEASDATDAYINARFLPAGSPLKVPFGPDDVSMVADEFRPRPRRFTIRDWNATEQLLTIDFVTHGDSGFAGSWAKRAKPGDRLQFEGPGGSYRPDSNVDWHLLVGDESTFGAIGASVQCLGSDAHAVVFAVVEAPGCEIDFPSAAEVTIHWLYREEADGSEYWVADVIAATDFPAGTFDVFVHGEAGEVRAVREHLAQDREVDLRTASISPYWRRRHTDEEWRKVKRDWMAGASTNAKKSKPRKAKAKARRTLPGATMPVLLLVAIMAGVAGCSLIGEAESEAAGPSTEEVETSEQPVDSNAESTSSAAASSTSSAAASAVVPAGLPERPGPRRETTGDVPHIQLDAAPVASVDAELKRLVFSLPGVEERESARSLPGAAGLWLADSVELARGEILGGGREIAHIHPDGSLHVFLPVALAQEVEETKWGELHPWVVRDGFWGGVAMVYTPETMEEVEVAFGLVVASYNFVVGASIDPTQID